MITADMKPFEEIVGMLGDARRVLVASCNTCVTVCHAGGKRQVALLASQLRIHAAENGLEREVREVNLERHCDTEFVELIDEDMQWPDAFLSAACGVGVNFLADRNPSVRILPALNTTFYGATDVPGRWQEMCGGCGNCALDLTAGICPVVRCAKAIWNGPCGGSQDGKCEVSPDVDCAWQLIIERLTLQGRAEALETLLPTRDWSTSTHGGWRRTRIVEEFFAPEEGEA